jgi:hypothetical protein
MARRLSALFRASPLLVAALTSPSLARADGASSGDELAAEAAFGEGRTLMQKGDYAGACAKFEASQRLSAALGTLMNLAECYAKAGRNASAWVTYKDAAAQALNTQQKEREQIARGRVSELEPTLCRLVVKPVEPGAGEGVKVTRDGAALDAALFGIGIPLDPGPHTLVFSGEGKESETKSVTMPAPQTSCPDTVLTFGRLKNAPPPQTDATRLPEQKHYDENMHDRPNDGSGRRTLALVAGGVGIVATGVATGFTIDAISKKNASDPECKPAGCTNTGKTLLDHAGTSADIATALFIGGGVLVAAGVVLWITAPSGERTSRIPLRVLESGGAIRF